MNVFEVKGAYSTKAFTVISLRAHEEFRTRNLGNLAIRHEFQGRAAVSFVILLSAAEYLSSAPTAHVHGAFDSGVSLHCETHCEQEKHRQLWPRRVMSVERE
jgi:hypothetical protein